MAKNAVRCKFWIIFLRRVPRHAVCSHDSSASGAILRLLGVSKSKREICNYVRGKCGSARGIEALAIEGDRKAGIARSASSSICTNRISQAFEVPRRWMAGVFVRCSGQRDALWGQGEVSRLREGRRSRVDGSRGSALDIEARSSERDPAAGIARFAN